MAVETLTFGCRLNAYESEVMKAEALKAGLSAALIVNTCAVTEEAVRQAFILNAPMKSLCRQDCKGICSVCGGNKNSRPCDCEARSLNPVLNRLADLLPRSGE